MPWTTPTLKQVRGLNRDFVQSRLGLTGPMVPNSVARILADGNAGLAFLTLEYIDWLANQLLPDTAETEWLDRHGAIWLVNADGSKGRKSATYATGTVSMDGQAGYTIPEGSQLTTQSSPAVQLQTTETVDIPYMAWNGSGPAPVGLGAPGVNVPVEVITPGAIGNLEPGTIVGLTTAIPGVQATASVVELSGGADTETDDELRARILQRIQNPPMGGDKADYVKWALEFPGVTRAWCAPLEMGMGTVTVRFMMDDLRAANGGFPLQQDLDAFATFLDTVRPVAVKDRFVVSPIPHPIDFRISGLKPADASVQAALKGTIAASIKTFLRSEIVQPGQTIYGVWKSDAVLSAQGVQSFDMVTTDDVMGSVGELAVLGNIYYT